MRTQASKKNISFLPNNGEMGALIQEKDWSETPVGSPETWSQSLRTTLSIILNSKFPMFLFWGPELICFYNDAYRPSLGDDGKHPAILGSRAEDFWQEIWSDIKPLIDSILAGGEANWSEDQLLPIFRNGRMEDVYWTFSYSPVNDESGKPGGVFVTCVETSKQVSALKDLKESQEKLEFALDAAELGTWDLNPRTNTFIYNQQLRHWFGLDPENEIEAPSALNAIIEKDRQITIDAMSAAMALESDGLYEIKHTVFSKFDGKERIILAKGKALFDKNGVVYRFSGTGQDVTDEVLYKKNQDEKINFNTMLLESNPDCVKIIDSDGRISYMNENGVCILEGDDKEYFINREWETLWSEKERILVHDAIEKAFQGQTINFQAPAITVKGTLKWWDIIISPLPDDNGKVKNLLAVSRDISGLKSVEKSLEESEEQLRFALEGGNLGFFDSFPQIGKLNWSAKAKEHFGLAPEAEVNLGVYKKLVHPDDYDKAQKVMLAALQNKNSDLYENEFRISHEKTKWLKIIGKIKHDESGVPVRVTGVIQDITYKKLADIKLSESEKNFRMLADQAPMWIWLTDNDVNILYANTELLKFVGIDHYTEFTGKVWETIVHPDDIAIVYKSYNDGASQQKSFNFECRLKNAATGIYEWIFLNVVARSEGDKFVGFIGTAINIHQQKNFWQTLESQVEERTSELKIVNDVLSQRNDMLSVSESFNRNLTELSPNVVYIHDLEENKLIFLNQTGLKLIGNSWDEVQNLGDKIQPMIIHPDDMPSVINTIEKVKKSVDEQVFEHEYRIKNANGNWTPILARDIAFKRNKQKEVIQILGIAIDITELKKAKNILEQKNEELEKMNKELESFAYVSSHDLQEPLRKIQTFSNRILEKEHENLSDSGKEYLRRMMLAGERMQQLIQDLLAYSRTKTSDRKFETTDLNITLRDIKDDLKEEIKQKNVMIETDESRLIKVKIIPFQFRQLIYNLISNSIKFSKTDVQPLIKLVCDVSMGSEFEHKSLKPNHRYYHIKISDNGIGFKSDYKEKIFEIFQRLHGREEYTGTGIGLAIVKKIVDNHNGFINASGELGVGATFDIYIPTNL